MAPKNTRFIWWALIFSLLVLLTACSRIVEASGGNLDPNSLAVPSVPAPFDPTSASMFVDAPKLIQPSQTSLPTNTRAPTSTPASTNTPNPTSTPSSTRTPVPTETPSVVWNPAGSVVAPILLYHHVSNAYPGNRYFVSVDDFRAQLQSLRDMDYSTIMAADLAKAIAIGGELPPRPVVITFDDGYQDVFEFAFPIMQEMGFVGVVYIYVNQVGLNGFMDYEQIRKLSDSGWEIGSHSMTHVDLTHHHSDLAYEVQESQTVLQQALGVNVGTFAYPYGESDHAVIESVKDTGYLAGMGLGLNFQHGIDSIFNLNRIEIRGDEDVFWFIDYIPWSDL